MLCSVPDSKSGSNWLDRLRSNKGFPTGDNLDLDHFLSRSPNSSSEFPTADASSTESTRPHVDRVANQSGSSYPTRDNQGKALVGLMTNVLSELFFMGGSDESSKLFGKKIPRKQTKPRVCVISTTNSNSNTSAANTTEEKSSGCARNDPNILDETASLNLDSISLMENKNVGNVGGGEGEEEEEEDEEEEEKGERELKGYSRSEVTVIDTSVEVWKTEKVVFRRKSVWKVREKKSRLRTFGRNKRKVVVDEEVVADDGDIDKKKAKVSASEETECIPLKSNEGQNSQNDTRKEACEDTPDNMNERREEFSKDNSKDIKKGFPFNRSSRKMKKGGSSVILIKGITTDKKNGVKLPKKCLKDSQKQYKA